MDDYGFDSGGYSLWNDTPDYGSGWDIGGGYDAPSFNFGGSGGGLDTSWLNSYIQPMAQPGGYSQGAMPMQAPAAQPQQGAGSASPWLGALLGAAGPAAGLIGALINQGQGPTTGPQPTTAQKANMATGNQLAQQGASGNLPAQQMQMSLLQALAGGQGLPAGYSQLIEQAFQPQMGDLYTQAATQGRRRGFHDAPGTSPPGANVLGKGLSDIQGQMASAKLGLMHSLPQLFNQPAATQGQFAQSYLGATQNADMMQKQVTQPMAPQLADIIGQGISGASQGYNAAAQQGQQQNSLNSLLEALQGNTKAIQGLSGTPRPMAQGGIVTKPTRALIGEAGPEAVVPLNGGLPPGLIQALIQALRGGGQPSSPTGAMSGATLGPPPMLRDPTLNGPVGSGALTGQARPNPVAEMMQDPRFKLGAR